MYKIVCLSVLILCHYFVQCQPSINTNSGQYIKIITDSLLQDKSLLSPSLISLDSTIIPSDLDAVSDSIIVQNVENILIRNLRAHTENESTEQMFSDAFRQRSLLRKEQLVSYVVSDQETEYIRDVMQKMEPIKNTYHSVNSMKSLLKGTEVPEKFASTGDKISLGGGFQFNSFDPVQIDLNPNILYNLNRSIRVSTGIICRLGNIQYHKISDINKITSQWGARNFIQYYPVNNWYLQAEHEIIKTKTDDNIWNQGVNIGLGKSIHLSGKMMGQVTILYHTNHQENTLYKQPVMIRFGTYFQ